jgi:hypothetical protein
MKLLAAILLLTLTGCSPHVDFVVPNSFHGMIYLITDPTNGVVIKSRDGLYTVMVPSGGKLRVQDLGFLERWHREEAHFANGERIPTVDDLSNKQLGFIKYYRTAWWKWCK